MNIEKKNIDAVNATIKMQIGKSDYQEAVDKALLEYKKKANVPGFRPGQTPINLVKKMFGKAAMADEINRIISESLYNYIKDNQLKVLGEPLPNKDEQKEIDFGKQEEFEFVFDIAIEPEFDTELSDKISVPYYEIDVTDEMVDNNIKSFRSRYGEHTSAQEIAEADVVKGELVEMRTKTKPKEDGIVVETAMICPKYMKNDEQKALFIGAKVGDAVSFNPKKAFDNDVELAAILKKTKEEAATITSDFKFTVKEVSRFVEAELNQDLFDKALGEGVVKSEEEFKQKIKEGLKNTFEQDSDFKLLLDTKDVFMQNLKDVVFPDAFLKRWVLSTNKDMKEEDLENQYPAMLDDLKWSLVKRRISEAKGIKVEKSDLENFARKVAQAQFAQYGMAMVPDDVLDNYVKEMFKKSEYVERLFSQAIDEKLMQVVKSSVKLDKKAISLEDFNKMFASDNK